MKLAADAPDKSGLGYPYLSFAAVVGYCLWRSTWWSSLAETRRFYAEHPGLVAIFGLFFFLFFPMAGASFRLKRPEATRTLRAALLPALVAFVLEMIVVCQWSTYSISDLLPVFKWGVLHTYVVSILILWGLEKLSGWLVLPVCALVWSAREFLEPLRDQVAAAEPKAATVVVTSGWHLMTELHGFSLLGLALPVFCLGVLGILSKRRRLFGAFLIVAALWFSFWVLNQPGADSLVHHKLRHLWIYAWTGDRDGFHIYPILAYFPLFGLGYGVTHLLLAARNKGYGLFAAATLGGVGFLYGLSLDVKTALLAYQMNDPLGGLVVQVLDLPGQAFPIVGSFFLALLPLCYWLSGRYAIERFCLIVGRAIFPLWLLYRVLARYQGDWFEGQSFVVSATAGFGVLFCVAVAVGWGLSYLFFQKRFEIILNRRHSQS